MTNRLWIAGAMTVALIEHIGLLGYATAHVIHERQHPSDMPFGYVIAHVLYIAVGTSWVSAVLFYPRFQQIFAERQESLYWTWTTMIVAPWGGVLLSIPGIWMGPLALLASVIGCIIPFLIAVWAAPVSAESGRKM